MVSMSRPWISASCAAWRASYASAMRVLIPAPRERVYAALLDPGSWKFPTQMTCEVHELDAREGGRLRISLTYTTDRAGKTDGRTDTYRGRFVKLVPNELVVEEDE